MKKRTFKRFLIAGGIFMTALTANPFGWVPASDIPVVVDAAAPEVAVPYADVIVWKYRISQGHMQKRRWNQTKGKWVDPAWITVD